MRIKRIIVFSSQWMWNAKIFALTVSTINSLKIVPLKKSRIHAALSWILLVIIVFLVILCFIIVFWRLKKRKVLTYFSVLVTTYIWVIYFQNVRLVFQLISSKYNFFETNTYVIFQKMNNGYKEKERKGRVFPYEKSKSDISNFRELSKITK